MKSKRIREYAQHRAAAGLPGGTHHAVQQAIESGRIPVDADGVITDFEAADAAWLANTASDHLPDTEQHGEMAAAKLRRAKAQAALAELELAERKRETERSDLVPLRSVQHAIDRYVAGCRGRWQGVVPSLAGAFGIPQEAWPRFWSLFEDLTLLNPPFDFVAFVKNVAARSRAGLDESVDPEADEHAAMCMRVAMLESKLNYAKALYPDIFEELES